MDYTKNHSEATRLTSGDIHREAKAKAKDDTYSDPKTSAGDDLHRAAEFEYDYAKSP